MLLHLAIKNYALIEETSIKFDKGFTTITGETGAGKSILIGALNLLLGQRADSKVLQNAEKKCVVEGEFDISNYELTDFFERNDLDYLEHTVIRREISVSGRSRSFVNDTPVTLQQLKILSDNLIDIHSQHQTLLLNSRSFQLKMVDSYCQHQSLLDDFSQSFEAFTRKKELLEQLKNQEANSSKEFDYKKFLFDELEDAKLENNNEIEDIEIKLKVLENAEEILSELNQALYLSQDSESSILSQFYALESKVSSASKHLKSLATISTRLNSNIIEFKDCIDELNIIYNKIEHNPRELEVLQNRYSVLQRLLKKHTLMNTVQLIELKDQLGEELLGVDNINDQIEKLENEVINFEKISIKKANEITQNRKSIIPQIEQDITTLLSKLGMPNAKVNISIHPTDLYSSGLEEIMFYFSANKGVSMSELKKVVSGGELSRLMLSLKFLIAHKTKLPSIIFDEIDTGVSGEIAHKIGSMMCEMGKIIQVFSITHLPQVAAKGNNHLLVKKEEVNDKTTTTIQHLDYQSRVQHIAKMLSGKETTQVALKNAKELLEN